MERYEITKWSDQYNIADNNHLNLVVFDHPLSKEEAERELIKLKNN